MDKITRFERILNLVERARKLDLMTVEVIGQINRQQMALYQDITCEPTKNRTNELQRNNETQNANEVQKTKASTDCDTRSNKECGGNNMDSKMSPNELMEFLLKTAEDMKRMKEVPPTSPTPPTDPNGSMPSKDMEALNKLKQMSATVAEHLKIQVDIHKYAAAAIHETHKLSFELYKDIDAYMKPEG
jgi:flagellum-specific peptidoglycan hydrolase FlgJ